MSLSLVECKDAHGSEGLTKSEGLAAQLRRLACEVERGEISTVIATIIRADGGKERISAMPGMN